MTNQYELWLAGIDGIGLKRYQDLTSYFGTAQDVFENATEASLAHVFGAKSKLSSVILSARNKTRLEDGCEVLQKMGIQTLIYGKEDYPYLLSEIYDPPLILYVLGTLLQDEKRIAMVGSRRCTRYGKRAATQIASQLASAGVTVVSGMARGIDSHAHEATLEAGQRTIAVLGCGVDVCYPPEKVDLYNAIQKNGAVISEYPPGTPPLAVHFPARNRIISGLASGVVLVESKVNGGAMHTINFATEQGRDVFAVPGNIDSNLSEGTNQLLKEMCIMARCGKDILDEYPHWNTTSVLENESQEVLYLPEMDFNETLIYQFLLEEEAHYEMLAQKLDMQQDTLAACLTMLEIRGIIKQLPGRMYEINKS